MQKHEPKSISISEAIRRTEGITPHPMDTLDNRGRFSARLKAFLEVDSLKELKIKRLPVRMRYGGVKP